MEREQLEEMGPVDYIVLEWPNQQPTGEAIPLILDLVDKGIIRILDIAVLAKDSDGSVSTLELGSLDGGSDFAEFEGDGAETVAKRCGFDPAKSERRSYLRLYQDYLKQHPDAPPEMTFR